MHRSLAGIPYVFCFDPTRHQLIGEHSNQRFRLGDSVKVKVVRVDLDEKKIDFELVKKAAASKKVGGAPVKKKRRKK